MKKLLYTALLLLPIALATQATASELYNKEIRAAAGDLSVRLAVLENSASKVEEQGATERAANYAAMAAWNFKQSAGLSNVTSWLKHELKETAYRMDKLKATYTASLLTGQKDVASAYDASLAAWDKLNSSVNPDVIPMPKPKDVLPPPRTN